MISSGRLIRLPSGGRGGSKANCSGFSPVKENERKKLLSRRKRDAEGLIINHRRGKWWEGGEGMVGGFWLCYNEINPIPPIRLCNILTIPSHWQL